MDHIKDFSVLAGITSRWPSVSEAKEARRAEEALVEEKGLPAGVKLEKKPGEEYWYVKKEGKTVGVISAHKGGTYDADTEPDGKGKFEKGFKTPTEAAQWILKQGASTENVGRIEGGSTVSEAWRGRRRPMSKANQKAAWMRSFEDELIKILGHRPPSIDWNDPEYLYTQGEDPLDVAHKIATRKYGVKTAGPQRTKAVLDATAKRIIAQTVKASKSYGMDREAAVANARFMVRQKSGVLNTPGAEEELVALVNKLY